MHKLKLLIGDYSPRHPLEGKWEGRPEGREVGTEARKDEGADGRTDGRTEGGNEKFTPTRNSWIRHWQSHSALHNIGP